MSSAYAASHDLTDFGGDSLPSMRMGAVGAGALLAVGVSFTSVALASSDIEGGAVLAAPTSCAAEQFVLRSYVTAVRKGDMVSGAHDPARISEALTPVCREAIQNGRWPGLTTELLARVSTDESLKGVICEIAPPEAMAAIVEWETAGDAAYDRPCAVALFRHRREDFARLVLPRLGAAGGCEFSDLTLRVGEALTPEERVALLPVLDFATRTRALGRDQLFGVLCQHPAARAQVACQSREAMEPEWAHQARVKRVAPGIGLHVGLALLFGLAASLLRYFRGNAWPAVRMSVAATVVVSATIAWILMTRPSSSFFGDSLNVVYAMVVAPLVALVAGGIAWAFTRAVRGAALPWCLGHAVLYGTFSAVHAWMGTWDRLC